MFVAGDEVGRTQGGNNNAYCQDSDLSWFDWTLAEKNAGLLRFFKQMIALRRGHASLRRRSFLSGGRNRRGVEDIRWHGLELDQAEWGSPFSRVLAFTLAGVDPLEPDLHVMMNMDDASHDFAVPTGRRPEPGSCSRTPRRRHPTTSRSRDRAGRSRASGTPSRAAAS